MGIPDPLEIPAQPGILARLEIQDLLAQPGILAQLEIQDLLVQPEILARLETLVQQETPAQPEI
ncbi:hypothetical protein AALB39_28865 [Lachnospiraceae bacterium 54-53]